METSKHVTHWTVISLNGDGVVKATLQCASDPHEAIQMTARELEDDGDTQIICAVSESGTLVIPPCEDSGKAAYLQDLKGEDVPVAEIERHPDISDVGLDEVAYD